MTRSVQWCVRMWDCPLGIRTDINGCNVTSCACIPEIEGTFALSPSSIDQFVHSLFTLTSHLQQERPCRHRLADQIRPSRGDRDGSFLPGLSTHCRVAHGPPSPCKQTPVKKITWSVMNFWKEVLIFCKTTHFSLFGNFPFEFTDKIYSFWLVAALMYHPVAFVFREIINL